MTPPVPLRVCIFSGASSLPIRIADRLGLWTAAGLTVDLQLTRGSKQMMEGLLAGRFDIVHAAPDNFIAWRDRTGTDILAWVGGTSGPLQLIGSPELQGIRDLAGCEIAVDSPRSGFVSVLVKLLHAGGVGVEAVELVQMGSTQMRYEALVSGATSATMLALPWSTLAVDAGFSLLGDRTEVLPRIQGSCGASLGQWLRERPAVADTYLRTLGGFNWLSQHFGMEVIGYGCSGASAGDSGDAGPDMVSGAAVESAA